MHTERLEKAHAALKVLTDELDGINEAMRKADQTLAQAQQSASATQEMKQQRRGLFARMLRAGHVDMDDEQTTDLSRRIAAADSVDQTEAIMEAHRDLVAELQQKAVEIHAKVPSAVLELDLARFEAAAEEIRRDAIPAFLAACDALEQAYGRLAGLGKAHCQMSEKITEKHGYGTAKTGPLGVLFPIREFDVVVTGFGLTEPHSMNVKRINAHHAIKQAEAEAFARWNAA